jgi:hypothetical protein
MPAKAGTHDKPPDITCVLSVARSQRAENAFASKLAGIPAFAGMTTLGEGCVKWYQAAASRVESRMLSNTRRPSVPPKACS